MPAVQHGRTQGARRSPAHPPTGSFHLKPRRRTRPAARRFPRRTFCIGATRSAGGSSRHLGSALPGQGVGLMRAGGLGWKWTSFSLLLPGAGKAGSRSPRALHLLGGAPWPIPRGNSHLPPSRAKPCYPVAMTSVVKTMHTLQPPALQSGGPLAGECPSPPPRGEEEGIRGREWGAQESLCKQFPVFFSDLRSREGLGLLSGRREKQDTEGIPSTSGSHLYLPRVSHIVHSP